MCLGVIAGFSQHFQWDTLVFCFCGMIIKLKPIEERGSKEVRARAQAALQDMTPSNLFRCGLTCDYSTECLVFLRENFDVDDPDPSQTSRIVDAFCHRMRLLFVDGYVLGDSKQVPLASQGQHGRSMTQTVFEQIETPEPNLTVRYAIPFAF